MSEIKEISTTELTLARYNELNPNQFWLAQYQVTAFWHGFGIANGLNVPEKFVTRRGGKVHIDPAFMRGLLDNFISWLESYEESWFEFDDHPYGINDVSQFIVDENEYHRDSRESIRRAFCLLQNVKNRGAK